MCKYRRLNYFNRGCKLAASISLMLTFGCGISMPAEDCAQPDATVVSPSVAGVFRYSGGGGNVESGLGFQLSGTITFEQQGKMVRVADNTYDVGNLRVLESEFAELIGNRVALTLTPQNGDENYIASVEFIFTADGSEFCVSFTDTNADMGGIGSFIGKRQIADS